MNYRSCLTSIGAVAALCVQSAWPAAPQSEQATRALAHDIFKQLIEINTTDSIGSTTLAAQAMARRLLDAGFPAADVVVMGPNDRKGNMVARYRGKAGSKLRPVLIIGHLDVVEARREDWTTDPFQFVEQGGYYYGRGTQDMKVSDAIAVTAFIRMKKEGYVPDRDIILALTADEEGGQSNGVDSRRRRSSTPITCCRPPIRAGIARCPSPTTRSTTWSMPSALCRGRRSRSS